MRAPAPILAAVVVLASLAAPAVAAEPADVADAAAADDRGPRGFFVGGGPALLLGTATDADGRDTPTYTGAGFRLRLGEEALPGLTLGLELIGAGGAGNDGGFEASLGGFLLQVGWRPFGADDPVVLLAGTGFGGGALEADASSVAEGATGGALHALGLAYELRLWGSAGAGGVIAPGLSWYFVPAAFDSDVRFSAFHLGVDLVWYAGR